MLVFTANVRPVRVIAHITLPPTVGTLDITVAFIELQKDTLRPGERQIRRLYIPVSYRTVSITTW